MPAVEKYKLRRGDTIAKVAFERGIVNWRKEVWGSPQNKDLRKQFKDPKQATPGTIIFLPKVKTAPGQIYAAVGGGRKCPNRPEDVKEVKKLINRWSDFLEIKPLSSDGKVNSDFLKALKTFQKQLVGKVDGVVGPRGKTLAALRQPVPKISLGGPIEIKLKGKKYPLTQAFVDKTNKQVSDSLVAVGKNYLAHITDLEEQCENILRGKGKAKRVHAVLLHSRNLGHFTKALKEIRACKRIVEAYVADCRTTKTAKLAKLVGARYQIQKVTNRAGASFNTAMKVVAPSIQVWIDVLEFTRDASFAVVETYLAFVLKNPIYAGGITGGIKQAATQVGTAAFVNQKWKNSGGLLNSIYEVVDSVMTSGALAIGGDLFGRAMRLFTPVFGRYIASAGFTAPAALRPDIMEFFGVAAGPNVAKFDSIPVFEKALNHVVSTLWNMYAQGIAEKAFKDIFRREEPNLKKRLNTGSISPEEAVKYMEELMISPSFNATVYKTLLKKHRKDIIKGLNDYKP